MSTCIVIVYAYFNEYSKSESALLTMYVNTSTEFGFGFSSLMSYNFNISMNKLKHRPNINKHLTRNRVNNE